MIEVEGKSKKQYIISLKGKEYYDVYNRLGDEAHKSLFKHAQETLKDSKKIKRIYDIKKV